MKPKHYFFNLLSIVIAALLLSSCSHMKGDGAPDFYVDASKVPNATPKPERLSKYGNMPSYRVNGKRYYPLKTCRNFQQVGIASWYGTKFHDQRTSSGERYDMLSMTAAHKTLPLPTYVEVTNLQNHKTIIVKVNDRGPFKSNRIIDLSYVAAKKLGMAGRGTAPVKIKAIDPYRYNQDNFYLADSHKSRWHSSQPTRLVYLHVATFKDKTSAEHLRRRLSTFVSAPITISRNQGQRALYRVQVGPIKDLSTANTISHKLRNLGMHTNKTYGV
jgi:rare lipoprotein A